MLWTEDRADRSDVPLFYQDTSQCKVKDYLCIVSTPANYKCDSIKLRWSLGDTFWWSHGVIRGSILFSLAAHTTGSAHR